MPLVHIACRNGSVDKLAHLLNQLKEGEILISLYENQVPALVASHIGSAERLREIEDTWGELWEFYAVATQELNDRINANQMEGSD